MATQKLPRVELLRVEVCAVTLHRDEAGRILEERRGPTNIVYTVERFADFYAAAEAEVASANAALMPNRAARRARAAGDK